jgi:hypothetical protein
LLSIDIRGENFDLVASGDALPNRLGRSQCKEASWCFEGVFIFDRLALVRTVTRLAGLETAPEVIASREDINSRTPPSSLFDMLIAFEDAIAHSTVVASGNGIGVQQIFVGVLPF